MSRKISQKQLEDIQELSRQRWNALVRREEKEYAAAQAAAEKRRAKLRVVKGGRR